VTFITGTNRHARRLVEQRGSYKAVVLDFALFLIALFALSILLISGCFYIVSDSRLIDR
jgi:hypothetical protein